jgi:hypothetical protein
MMQIAEERPLDRTEGEPRRIPDRPRNTQQPALTGRARPAQVRLPLLQRHALRDPVAYAVEVPEGEIGFVTEMRIGPYEYWPEELIVEASDGSQHRVPVDTVSAVLPREGRLLVTSAPAGARPVPRARESWLAAARMWRLAAAAGALLALGGYVATLVALALGTAVTWSPGLAASGATGGAVAAASWRSAGRSWLAAAGLGSFWLPLGAGVILSPVLIFG